MHKNRVLLVVVAIVIAFFHTWSYADVAEATFTPQGLQGYAPRKPEDVVVYVYRPEFKFKIIGLIEAHGMAGGNESLLDQVDIIGKLLSSPPTEKDDIKLAMKALKEEAGKAGAEAVIILKSVQVQVSQNSTERQIRAVAIIKLE